MYKTNSNNSIGCNFAANETFFAPPARPRLGNADAAAAPTPACLCLHPKPRKQARLRHPDDRRWRLAVPGCSLPLASDREGGLPCPSAPLQLNTLTVHQGEW